MLNLVFATLVEMDVSNVLLAIIVLCVHLTIVSWLLLAELALVSPTVLLATILLLLTLSTLPIPTLTSVYLVHHLALLAQLMELLALHVRVDILCQELAVQLTVVTDIIPLLK